MSFLILRISPQIQVSFRRAFASVPPPEPTPLPQAQAQATPGVRQGTTTSASSSSASPPPPPPPETAETEGNPLMLFLRAHKKQRLAIATVIVAGISADMTLTYFTFFHKRKEEEAIQTETVLDGAQKVAPQLTSE